MRTERLDAWTERARRVAIWRGTAEAPAPDAPIVVLSAGFARRMRHVSALALCLVNNGATVYRFDSVDHIGLSDGDVVDFTLTGMYESLRATMELAREIEGRRKVRLVALSLSAMAAFRLAAEDPEVESITAVSGPVDGRATLHRVIGTDYTLTTAESELPPLVNVEGQDVDPRALWRDDRSTGWMSIERTISWLSAVRSPVANFVASGDPWVDINECEAAFAKGAGGPRTIIRLPYSGHDLGRSPVAAMALLEKLAQIVLNPEGRPAAPAVVLPSFEALLESRIAERAREEAERSTYVTERSEAR